MFFFLKTPVGSDDRHPFVTFIHSAFEIFELRKQSEEGWIFVTGIDFAPSGLRKCKDQPHYGIQEFYGYKSELNNELSRQASGVVEKLQRLEKSGNNCYFIE